MNENKSALKKEQGKRLRESRDYLGLSQTEFGETCDLKWSQVKDRELGVVEIKLFLAMKIERKHGIDHDWLLAGQGEMKATAAADKWKDQYIAELREENAELRKKLDRLTAPPISAEDSDVS